MNSGRKINSTDNINRKELLVTCPFMRALIMIEGRWKLVIICRLRDEGNQSFSGLQKLIPNASKRMIAKALNELVADNIVLKQKTNTYPLSSEYSLSEHGINLLPIIEQLKDWGQQVKPQTEEN
ncbi:winged helix-turn-helix transcriptional regulator [Marinifilum caeruleilacunae]|uniref:Transcriptional regulator n=1 Tax=Marinifilum caeruleilacunae TaxID=2499076 RepID=A0ABX1WRD2_9BACT|nr:helix-turn-helix domain-containing protein [Marinifilum caeruleilacunae]NOU58489.1 transcriptional regulator [Marinifilum caeruleilacunae]